MGLVTYVSFDGEKTEIDVPNGDNLMQAALDNGISGTLGDCGGGCACATCHCIVDDAWAAKSGEPDELEADMLDGLIAPNPTSRLSCQIIMKDELDGIVVHLPESQL